MGFRVDCELAQMQSPLGTEEQGQYFTKPAAHYDLEDVAICFSRFLDRVQIIQKLNLSKPSMNFRAVNRVSAVVAAGRNSPLFRQDAKRGLR
jgi:hypothetical protein